MSYAKQELTIEFKDGSKFTLPEVWTEAFYQRFSGREDRAKKGIKEITEEHFVCKTKPSAEDPRMSVDWNETEHVFKEGFLPDTYETHSDIAPEVIYPMIKKQVLINAFDKVQERKSNTY